MKTESKQLPPLRDDLRDFEIPSGTSVDVLVRPHNSKYITIGRYFHGLGEWQINNCSGQGWEVEEWWPMPVIGTGHKL